MSSIPAEFLNLCEKIENKTVLTPDRLWYLWISARQVVDLEGQMAECGTYKGGSAYLIYNAVHGRKPLHIFDTFKGIPEEGRLEGEHAPGDFSTNFAEVKRYLRECKHITFHPGLVPATLDEVKLQKFNFVYLDMDLYQPTRDALSFFWARLSTGGVVILDDTDNLAGITRAIGKFLSTNRGYKIVKTCIDQVKLIKIE